MKIRPCAIIITENKLLTLKYIYNGTPLYAIPGGNLEFGEKLEVALARELLEEIGLKIEVKDLLFVAEVHQPNKDTLHCVFNSNAISGEPKINPKETSAIEISWLPISEIQQVNLYPNIKNELFEKFAEGKDHGVFLGEITQPWY